MVTVVQKYVKDVMFWRPKSRKVCDNDLWVSVSQINGKAKVSIPTTSKIVNRQNGFAAYLRFPFYAEPTTQTTPPISQATQLSQGYPDADGNQLSRQSVIYKASQQTITSDGNPSIPPAFEVGEQLLIDGTFETAPASNVNVSNTPAVVNIGTLSQSIVGRATNSTTQNLWTLGGNPLYLVAGGRLFGANAGVYFSQVTLNPDTTFTVTSNLVGAVNRIFPSCCVIEGERFLDQLFYTGGYSSWAALSLETKIINTNGTTTNVTNCPVSMTDAACLSSPKNGSSNPQKYYITVTGGVKSDFTDSQDTIYTYDPYLDVWGANQTLVTPRRHHQMINIKVGGQTEILVVGGKRGVSSYGSAGADPGLGIPLNSCEIVDGFNNPPSTNNSSSRRTGSMADARYAFGMVELPDGRVLVCGGIGYNPAYAANYPDTSFTEFAFELNRSEIYDPTTGFWTPIAPMVDKHSYCVCSYVKEANKVYVYGGYNSTIIEYLDLNTWTWHKSVYTLPAPKTQGAPFAMSHGFMGILGGGYYNTTTNVFVPHVDTWNVTKALNVPEYTRYDGLNAEWYVSDYDVPTDTLFLTTVPLGDYRNTNVKWSDNLTPHSVRSKFTLAKAVASSSVDIVGPYVFDETQPFVISGVSLTTTQPINKGGSYDLIKVTAGAFEVQEGWVVFNYGYENQEGPIRCFRGTDATTLQIDAGYKFLNDIPAGSTVNVLFQKGGYESKSPVGSFWLTASNAARAVAIDMLQKISAAGIELDVTTRYPGDRALGGEGFPWSDNYKLSDVVEVFGTDDLDTELADLKGS